jgi:hypothetical protein
MRHTMTLAAFVVAFAGTASAQDFQYKFQSSD